MIKLEPLPMEEAQAFWKDKVKLGPGQFAKLSDEAKLKAFAIGGIAKGDELDTVFTALQRAIDDGISFDQFKKECGDIFERRGWTGKRSWRVDNIFRTNIQTAYNIGHYKQLQDDSDIFPYWQYSAINDTRTRPTHLGMDGRVWPKDHEVWNKWYPPNGYRCRCSVIGLTANQVKQRGITVEEKDVTDNLIVPIDPRSGNTTVPRLMIPDEGFGQHPGKLFYGGIVESRTKDSHLYKALPNLLGPADFKRPKLENVKAAKIADLDETMLLDAGLTDEAYKAAFIDLYGEELVVKDAIGEPVILSLRSYVVIKDDEKLQWKFSKPGHGELIPLLQEAITNPYEVWLTPQKNGAGKVRLARRYICLWKTADKKRAGGLLAFEVAGGVFQGITAFVPMSKGTFDLKYVERQREGVLLYKR